MRFFISIVCFPFLFLTLFQTQTYSSSIVRPINLRCEYLKNPIGVDSKKPRLSWLLNDDRNGAKQTAYRVFVAKDSLKLLERKNIIWNSGKIKSYESLINYNGDNLETFTKYFWLVEIWDKDGKISKASEVFTFETGMMQVENWRGTWISDNNDINILPAPYFRKVFSANKKVKSARAYIAVGGLYELYLNGEKVGNHRLDPMFTRYDRRSLYVTYDVTSYLQTGKNAIGVILGNGWYNHQAMAVWNFDKAPWRARPTFCLDLKITYDDGSEETIITDRTWKSSYGPIIRNNIYTAEHYDSRLEQIGWNTIKFDDSKWKGIILRTAPSKNIVSQLLHPIRNVQNIPVQNFKQINDSTYLFDLGRNIAGVTKLKIKGESGTVVRLKHGERLNKDGILDLSNINVYHKPKDKSDPFQTDIIILNGNEVDFMAKFNYKGFRYIEITSSKPVHINKESLTAYFMHSDVPGTGKINSSNSLINKIWWATNNSYLSNLYGLPTDCPQREKNGWTGDGHFAVETGIYNFDAITIYEKWIADHRDEQQPNGLLPDIIPTGGWGYGTANGTDWTSSIAIIPWTIYMHYGDAFLLSQTYPNIKSYVDYITNISPNGLTSFGRGDWVPVKSKSNLEYTSSVYYYVTVNILAKSAKLLGNLKDFEKYSLLAEKIKNAVNSKYFNTETNIYGKGVQTEQSLALYWGLVPDNLKKVVAENLAKRVIADGLHLDVGVLGAKAILSALSDNGQAEIAYKLASQDTYPSWGWWIANGATTLLENWNLNATNDISDNHMMFGEIGGWLFKGLGGIKVDEKNPGFKNVLLSPNFVLGLDNFESSHVGPYGEIVSSWKRVNSSIVYTISIPANSTATIQFPVKYGQKIYQSGKIISEKLNVNAGKYEFIIR